MIIPYDSSKEERDKVVAEREKKLFDSFEEMRKKIDEQIQGMNFSTVSEKVRRQQLEEIRHELQNALVAHYNSLESGLKDDMVEVGGAVLKESESFYSDLQMPIGMSITSFPVEIMNNIVNGSVYEEKWYLSKALWGDYTEKLDQINDVITQGVGLNLSSLEIAKQLEQYVDPKAMTPSKTIVTDCLKDPVTGKLYSKDYVKRHPEKDWTGFTETKSRYRYGKVDYNAQRLSRTLINHAYQQNVVQQAKANPFGTGVRWDASGGERMCEICEERDGKVFPVDDVPLDHPNGMCTFEVVTDLDMMEMSNVLADWVNGVPTDYDEKLDAWYNDRAEVPIERTPDMFAQHVIAEGKDLTGIWQRREDEYDYAIEDVMAAQGFDGLPRVVSKEEFERLVAEANGGQGFIAQRTYSAADQETLDMYRDMLYNGKWYVDCGTGGAQYGQGMYCAADYNGQLTSGIKAEMQHYQELGNSRLAMSEIQFIELKEEKVKQVAQELLNEYISGLHGDEQIVAKFIIGKDYSVMGDIDRINKEDASAFMTYLKNSSDANARIAKDAESIMSLSRDAFESKYGVKTTAYSYVETLTLDPSAKVISYDDLFKRAQEPDAWSIMSQGKTNDLGVFAATLGYDAINAEGHGESGSYTVVLNRTKLIIQGDE